MFYDILKQETAPEQNQQSQSPLGCPGTSPNPAAGGNGGRRPSLVLVALLWERGVDAIEA